MINLSQINAHTFNPEILYVYRCSNKNYKGHNHHHDFLEMSIVLDGSVSYHVEGETFLVKKGTILLFNPGVDHFEYNNSDTETVQLHIGFRNFLMDGFPRNTFPIAHPLITLNKHENEFLTICQNIIREEKQKLPGYDIMLKSSFMRLIILILRDLSPENLENSELDLSFESREKQQIVSTIISYMENNYMKEISLAKLSKNMYVSPIYISKIFKEETGDSPINYLIQIRLTHAKKLLQTGLSVKSVAQTVGYEDAYYFSKLFKKHYGYPPSQLIKKKSLPSSM